MSAFARDRFSALFRPQLDVAYRTALILTRHPEDAEDLVQEAYLRAYQALVAQPELAIRNPRTWLLTLLRRLFIDLYRAGRRLPVLDELAVSRAVSADANPEHEFWMSYTHDAFQDAIQELPEEFRLVFHSVVVEGMSYREASEIAQCSIGTVMSRVHRGKRMVRRELAKLI